MVNANHASNNWPQIFYLGLTDFQNFPEPAAFFQDFPGFTGPARTLFLSCGKLASSRLSQALPPILRAQPDSGKGKTQPAIDRSFDLVFRCVRPFHVLSTQDARFTDVERLDHLRGGGQGDADHGHVTSAASAAAQQPEVVVVVVNSRQGVGGVRTADNALNLRRERIVPFKKRKFNPFTPDSAKLIKFQKLQLGNIEK